MIFILKIIAWIAIACFLMTHFTLLWGTNFHYATGFDVFLLYLGLSLMLIGVLMNIIFRDIFFLLAIIISASIYIFARIYMINPTSVSLTEVAVSLILHSTALILTVLLLRFFRIRITLSKKT